jgi:phage terminase small subunit
MPKNKNKTSDLAERFCREYVIDLNGTRAAIAAGYSEKGAGVRSAELLNRRSVQQRLDQLKSARASKLDVKAERVIEELARLAFSNMADYMEIDAEGKPIGLNISKLSRDQAAAIQEISEDTTGGAGDGERRLVLRTKFKLADKIKALELLGRHLALFQDNLKITGLEGLADKLNQVRMRKHGGGS